MNEMLANRYLIDGQAEQAAEMYQQILARKGAGGHTRCRLIASLALAGRTTEAVAELQRLVGEGGSPLVRLQDSCTRLLSEALLGRIRTALSTELQKGSR